MSETTPVKTELSFHEKIVKIQTEISVPKNKYNDFGKYKYRASEDILQALDPFLKELSLKIKLTDKVALIGVRYYIEATAIISDKDGNTHEATAFAREPDVKKGMDESQITGTSSSYARKYSLNGLLKLDDEKDSDTPDKKPAIKKEAGAVVANNMKEIEEAVANITTELGRITKNLNKDQKAKFMVQEVGVQAFLDIKKKPMSDLSKILIKLKEMPTQEVPNEQH